MQGPPSGNPDKQMVEKGATVYYMVEKAATVYYGGKGCITW
jgi:hypothetical protein